ncbi:MAG TPA: hypothetical protein VIY28_15380 [Pseudonocardiaceae bacterium]
MREVRVPDRPRRTQGRREQRTDTAPATAGQWVAQANRNGVTEDGQAHGSMANGPDVDEGERFHGHSAMIRRLGSSWVSNG